jgi:hypothetical protein
MYFRETKYSYEKCRLILYVCTLFQFEISTCTNALVQHGSINVGLSKHGDNTEWYRTSPYFCVDNYIYSNANNILLLCQF